MKQKNTTSFNIMKNEKRFKEYFNRAAILPAGWQGNLYFKNGRGQTNRYGRAPALGKKNGTIVLTNGYGESIDLYYETIKKFQKRGYEIWAMDWTGMGKSDRDNKKNPLIVKSDGISRHVDDLDHFVKNIVKYEEYKPLIISAHSLGGHVGLLYIQKHKDVFDGAILSAPMFDVYQLGLPKIFRPAIKMMFNIASSIGLKDIPVPGGEKLENEISKKTRNITELGNTSLTLREEWRRIMGRDQEINRPTFGWIASAFKSCDKILDEEFIKSIKTPVLIGSAGFENLVNNKAHEYVARTMGSKARLVKMESAKHNLWHADQDNHVEWWKNVSKFLVENNKTANNDLFKGPKERNDNSPSIKNNNEDVIPKIKFG
jgi:lysophospholipase